MEEATMKRITPKRLALALLLTACATGLAAMAFAASTPAPTPTAAIIKERVFNDCPTATVTSVNHYPALISIDDSNNDCFGFANLHVWTLSQDGVNEAVFDNPAHFRLSMDFMISGDGNGEGGIRISPWYSHDADGLFNVRTTDGEIACFGGRLPFFTFTGAFGLHYVKGEVINLAVIYEPHGLSSSQPGTIEYRVRYHGNDYTSGVIPFDQGNASEDPPHGLWGILNDARVGGHFKHFLGQGTPTDAKATFSNISFTATPPIKGAVTRERVFNDCPTSTLVTTNNYPSLISFDDSNLDCFGFANLHIWRFSENGTDAAIFNNNASFRFATDFKIEGTGNGEGGLQIGVWYSQDADGLFNVRSTDGEIACFGGRLPFFTFTGAFGLHYAKGNTIHLEAIYTPNDRNATNPATIEYKVGYLGNDYSSGVIPFDQANPSEDPPHTLYGILNEARVGGHFKAFLGQGNPVAVKGTFTNIVFSTCLHPANVSFELKPHLLNLQSNGMWVTAYITPASPLDANDIDVSSLRLNGVPAASNPAPSVENGNTLKVKFDRRALQLTLHDGDNVPVLLTGEIDGQCIESTDHIDVKGPKVHSPHADDQLQSGMAADVTWDVDPEASSVTLQLSLDNGQTWSNAAQGLANNGSYRWAVPNVTSSTARLAVVSVFEQDATGPVNQSEYAVSDPFSVTAPLGVGGGTSSFALRVKNPVTGDLTTSFSLPTRSPATLAVFDVAGRAVITREVGGSMGNQTLQLGRLPAGLYVVRLSQSGRSVTNRVAVVQ
jgi:hypothetical protein